MSNFNNNFEGKVREYIGYNTRALEDLDKEVLQNRKEANKKFNDLLFLIELLLNLPAATSIQHGCED